MSQPPFPPPPAAPRGGGQPPAPPIGGGQPPAAPTQVGFPGQVQLAPQPQYAPSPQQAQALQGGPLAVGFPNYRSPQPSPPWMTGKIVGAVVVLATVVFAVVGFIIVSGRGANSPEGAVEQFVQQMNERDAEGVYDLLCEQAARETSVGELEQALALLPPGEIGVDVHDATEATNGAVSGQNVSTTVTANGQSGEATFFVTEDKGWRVCGGDGTSVFF